MKNNHKYLLFVAFTALGFILGLSFNGLFAKAHAENEKNKLKLPETEKSFEVMSSGAARNADYEIISIYGRKYIIFSSGSDIEVLNY